MRTQKPRPDVYSILRLSGVAGIAVIWVGVSIALVLAHMSIFAHKPLSYLGIQPVSATLFNGSVFASAVLFIAFGLYIYKHYKTSPSFLVAFFAGQICQLIVALVPVEGTPTQHAVHTDFGLALGLSLPVLIWRFYKAQTNPAIRMTARTFSYVELGLCITGVLLSKNGIGVLAEVLAAAGFHGWIIWLSYQDKNYSLTTSP